MKRKGIIVREEHVQQMSCTHKHKILPRQLIMFLLLSSAGLHYLHQLS